MKLCSLQLFHLMPFRALKAIYTWLCIIWGERKLSMDTLCSIVVREASREARG
jgi:hypothetical protein